jgi:hypothetical protein
MSNYFFTARSAWLMLILASCWISECGCGQEAASVSMPTTNEVVGATTNQILMQTNKWHWDQAKADALKQKIASEHNFDDINAYAEMMREKLDHQPPSNEIPLPNFDAGPGIPLPTGMNFYQKDEHYQDYVICTYNVSENHYDRSNESEWFKAAILQIRGCGPDRFPPVKWFAIVIFNRGEFKDASTFEQCHKVGAVFKATEVFNPERDPLEMIAHAGKDLHPFSYDPQQPMSSQQQRWMIVERYAATNNPATGSK